MPTATVATTALAEPTPAPVLRCGNCGNTGVRMVSSIVAAQSWSSRSVGISGGVATDGRGHYGNYSGTTSTFSSGGTPLAQSLTAPALPLKPTYVGVVFSVILAILSLFAVITLSISRSAFDYSGFILGYVLLFMGSVGGIFICHANTNDKISEIERATPWHMREMTVWNRLSFCSKCDHVTDSRDGYHQRRENWRVLLLTPAHIDNNASQIGR